jgi:hypothetical protein
MALAPRFNADKGGLMPSSITIEGPNGSVATLNIPDGATDEQIRAKSEEVKSQMVARANADDNVAANSEAPEDGSLVQAARATESFIAGAVLDGEERRNLLNEIANSPKPPGYENLTLDEKVMLDQQALWDEVPPLHKFAIGFTQAISETKDWGLEAMGFSDGEARRAREEVYRALDEQNQDASDAGEIVGMISELAVPGLAGKRAAQLVGFAWGVARGSIKGTVNVLKRVRDLGISPETATKVAKSTEGKNLFKVVKKGDEQASEMAQEALMKKVEKLDPVVKRIEAVKNPQGLNPMQLRAQRERASKEFGERQATRAERVQDKGRRVEEDDILGNYNKAQKEIADFNKKVEAEKTLGLRGQSKQFQQQQTKAALRQRQKEARDVATRKTVESTVEKSQKALDEIDKLLGGM